MDGYDHTLEPAESLQFPRGLPRPRAGGRPVPWTADHDCWTGFPRWRQVNLVRQAAAIRSNWCVVCGMPLGDTAMIAGPTGGTFVLDGAVHARPCWDMTLASCPGISQNLHRVTVLSVRTDELVVWTRSDGRPYLVMPGATPPY